MLMKKLSIKKPDQVQIGLAQVRVLTIIYKKTAKFYSYCMGDFVLNIFLKGLELPGLCLWAVSCPETLKLSGIPKR